MRHDDRPHPADAEVRIRTRRGFDIVAVTGELDVASAGTLVDAAQDVGHDGRSVVLDISGVSFIDVAGLQCLRGTVRRLRDAGVPVHVSRPSHRAERHVRLIDGAGVLSPSA